jgi:hypothetical protein
MPATARGCSEATERGSEDRRELVRDVRYNSQTHSDPLGVMTDRGHMSDTAVQSDTKSTAAPPSSDEIADLVSLVEGHFRQQASTHDHRACSDGESFESCWCQRGEGRQAAEEVERQRYETALATAHTLRAQSRPRSSRLGRGIDRLLD